MEAEESTHRPARGISRRGFLGGALGVGAFGALAAPPSKAAASTLPTIGSVLANATASVGGTWNSGAWYTYGDPGGFNSDWCAQFVSWLLQGGIMSRRTTVTSGGVANGIQPYYSSLHRFGQTPTVGSLIIYGDPGQHVGIVQAVNGTATWKHCVPIEGNATSAGENYQQSVVKWRDGHHPPASLGPYQQPWGFCYPIYGDYDSLQGGIVPAGPNPYTVPPTTKGPRDMELYSSTAPNPVPAKYLALNSGLTPNLPIYMLIPPVGIPRITEDQNLASEWSQQIFGQPSNTGIIQISWGWFDQLFTQQNAIATGLGG